jgi:hypothetical protein
MLTSIAPPRASESFHFGPGKGIEWFTPDWGPVRGSWWM